MKNFLAAVVLYLIVCTAADGVPLLTFFNCSDHALCLSGCWSVNIPTESCQITNFGSQILNCDDKVGVCGDLSYYSDSACTNLQSTEGFVCGKCSTSKQSAWCRVQGPTEYLEFQDCDPQCDNCKSVGNVTANTCVPWGTAGQYARYTGAALCTAVLQQMWVEAQNCGGNRTGHQWIPQNACVNGGYLKCTWPEEKSKQRG